MKVVSNPEADANIKIGSKLYGRLRKHRAKEDRFAGLGLLLLIIAVELLASLAAFLTFCAWFYVLLMIPVGLGIYYYLRRPSLYLLARRIEAEEKGWQDRLSTAVDLSAKRNPRETYSREMIAGYVEGIEGRLNAAALSLTRKRKTLIASLWILTGTIVIVLLASFALPARMKFGFDAVFAPHRLDLRIEALMPDTLVEQGDRVEVTAEIHAPIDIRFVYLISDKGRQRVRVKNRLASQRITVETEEKIHFERLNRRSEEVYVGLLQPFEIRRIEFTVSAPAYTGEKPRTSTGARFSALPGSRVAIEGAASAELSQAWLIAGDSAVELRTDGRGFTGAFEFSSQANLSLLLKNRSGAQVEQKIEVITRHDEQPLVEVFMPGRNTEVNRFMSVTLGVHALDDYGLGQVRLVTKGTRGQTVTLAGGKNRVEDTIFYRWDVSGLGLLPGEEVTYYVEAADNDIVSGPKWGRSRTYRLRFPDISEMFSDVTEHGEQTLGQLSDLGADQEFLSAELARIEQKLRAEQTLSPQEQERLKELIREQEKLLSSVDSLAAETRKLLQQLEEGMIADPETAQKLSALSQMLADLMPPDLQQKLTELARILAQDPQRLAETMSKTGDLSAEMQTQLNQALEAIEKFLQEQRLAELAEAAQALARMQEELMKQVDDLSAQEAAQKQQAIEQGIEEVAQEAADLADELENPEIARELREIAAQMASENVELSQSIEKSLKQGKMNRSDARQLSANLKNTGNQMNMMLANLQKKRNQALQQEMAKLTRELLLLSEEHENLLGRIDEEENLELAARATELERALERKKEDVYKLASQSFKLPREAMHSLASASRDAQAFKQSLIQGKKGTAKQQGRSAQHQIDRATSYLLAALAENSGQAGSSTGLDELMQSLSAMSLAQLSLNQQMGGLLPLPISTESMTAGQRQALSELMAQQSALRQQMEELTQAAGQEPGLSGMLEGIIEEMKALEEDMARYVGQRRMVDRGEHIFRRLLDARNVLRKKNETRERERETGTLWQGLTSPSLPQDAGERNLYLKKELLRFLQSDYPEEYKRLARAYLEALLDQE